MAKRLKVDTRLAIRMGLTAYSKEQLEIFADILDDVVILAIGKHEDRGFDSDQFGTVVDVLTEAVIVNYEESQLIRQAS